MKSGKIIDLDKQLKDLLKKEELLAYFDFHIATGGKATVSGICKISKPKPGESRSRYFAILFIIDTPNEAVRKRVHTLMCGMKWDRLHVRMPGFKTAFPIPYMNISAELYFIETDVYVTDAIEDPKAYIAEHLYPALLTVTGFRGGELVFWDDAAGAGKGGGSLLQRLKALLI